MHRRFVASLLLFWALLVPPVRAAESPSAENLPRLVEAALSGNPELKASAARWEMLRSRVRQAGSFEDPMLMLKIQSGIVTDPFNFAKDSMTAKVIGISQQLPYFGKRALREEVAAREAEVYRFTLEERRLELARMVKESYFRLYYTDRSLTIVEKNLGVLQDFITIAQTKYSVGQGAQQDIFKAQLEHSKALELKITLEQQRKSLAIGLNALLFRAPDTPVGAIPEIGAGTPPLSAQKLKEISEANRPLLKGLKAQIRKGEGAYQLARKERFPDFNVSLEYMQRDPAMGGSGLDMYSLGVTFNLPVRKERREAMAAEASSETAMAYQELAVTQNAIGSGIADLLSQLDQRKRLIELYQTGIIPQAQQSLESATIGYRVNKVDFLSLLDSRVTLFNYEREYYDALADYHMKLAQLSALVGRDIE